MKIYVLLICCPIVFLLCGCGTYKSNVLTHSNLELDSARTNSIRTIDGLIEITNGIISEYEDKEGRKNLCSLNSCEYAFNLADKCKDTLEKQIKIYKEIKKIYEETPTNDIKSKGITLKLLYKNLIDLEDEHIQTYKEFYTNIFGVCDENCESFIENREMFKNSLDSQLENINKAIYSL